MRIDEIKVSLKGYAPHLILLIVSGFVLFYNIRNIVNFPGYSGSLGANGADEGVFLMTARLVSSGAEMYRDVNTHQGPLFSFFLTLLEGDPVDSRIMTAILGLVCLTGVMILSDIIAGKKAALYSGIFLSCNFLFFKESRHVSFDLYATTLLVLGLVPILVYLGDLKEPRKNGKNRVRPFLLLGVSGVLFSASAMSKLFAVIPAFFLGFYLLYGWYRGYGDESKRGDTLYHLIFLTTVTLVVTLVLLSIFGFEDTLKGIFLDTLDRPSMSMMERMKTTSYIIGILSVPLLFSVYALWEKRGDHRISLLAFLLLPLSLFLLVQSTIWDHYFLMIIPFTSVLGSVGLNFWLKRYRRDKNERRNGRDVGPNLRFLRSMAIVVVTIFVVISGGINILMLATTDENIERRVADDISDITQPGEMMISGDPIISIYADRDQPEEATNLAQLRFPSIDSDYLINVTAQQEVSIVVLTYNLVNYEKYVDFIKDHFEFYRGYKRPDFVSDIEGDVEIHLNTFNVYIRPVWMDQETMMDLYYGN